MSREFWEVGGGVRQTGKDGHHGPAEEVPTRAPQVHSTSERCWDGGKEDRAEVWS